MRNVAMSAQEPRHLTGDRGPDGRYPVTVEGELAGHIYRWHGEWYACLLGQVNEVRCHGRESAAASLAALLESGASPGAEPPKTGTGGGVSPWLHPRMKPTRRNIINAGIALGWVARNRLGTAARYPGFDNPWTLRCLLCGQDVERWWSHMRGRNGDPTPSRMASRGCIPFEEQASRVAVLVGEPVSTCPCVIQHPTVVEALPEVLNQAAAARRAPASSCLYLAGRSCRFHGASPTGLSDLVVRPESLCLVSSRCSSTSRGAPGRAAASGMTVLSYGLGADSTAILLAFLATPNATAWPATSPT
ncbi:hypothetical protein [Streptomyces sp. 891-h]|uniref:hypothetical protein n=1 Tax=Streptomyces sp. 891-h TaxID=2720714 RepID=UPI001FA9F3DF|nr:hypothetical protein [Streptomyces sp. 891-h]UNZ21411.1 hypothetical protein HC362_34525 [Streptomyces sp. 891-h]